MAFAYPVLLDLSDWPILIVGGGEVAARKGRSLIAAGAVSVHAVAPVFAHDFPDGVSRITAVYTSDRLSGMRLVFAATDDPDVNRQVVLDAQAAGIFVNRADHDSGVRGDFTVPAIHRDGSLTIAVSTGHSPALAAMVRNELARMLDPGWVKLATLTEILRPRIAADPSLPPPTRRTLLRLLASPAAMEIARTGDVETLWNWLLQQHLRPDADVL